MRCPYCGNPDTRVIDSRPAEDKNSIRRRRSCDECGRRFTTYEKVETIPLIVIKKDNNREQYERSKIEQGVLSACYKRPVPAEACGGGSVMDAAKLASVLVTDDYGVKELLDNPGMAQKCVPIVLIPTTAGTGAEVTPNAIVAVPEKELKVGIVNENMIADYVILDARMIKNLPRKIAAATGVDALAHCIECFTSNKANPFSDLYALEGLDLILNNIEKACDDPDAMAEKNRMQIAAYYGGLAITASGTTAVHALSYPLGGKYHIAHGVSNAILLAPVMRFNSEHPAVKERLAVAYDRCCHENKTCTTVDEKTAWMIARLEAIVKHLDIPTSLKEFGVPAEDLEGLVESGMQVQRLLVNNMRPVTADDARKLYQEIM